LARFAVHLLRGARFIFCALFITCCGVASAAQGEFVVGAVPGAVPPLDLSAQPASAGAPPVVRGISADFAREVAQSLGLALQWRVYPDRPAMIAALARGEIDAATTATGDDPGAPLLLSRPYLPTKQVHVEPRERRAATGRIAYVEAQTSPERLRSAYPQLRPAGYRTATAALLAVTLGDADAFVGDLVATTYAIGHFDFTALRITGFAPFDEAGYSFAFAAARPEAAAWRERVDAALAALPARFLLEIRARWGAMATAVSFDEPLALTDAERAWIAAHPVVPYSMLGRAAPLTFRDANGRPAGFAVDILAAIARITGLRFDARVRNSIDDIDRDMRDGDALLTPFGQSAAAGAGLLGSRPYGEGLFLIVTHAGAAPRRDAASLAGARVAVPGGALVESLVRERVPSARVVPTANYDAQFDALANGRADAAVADMAFANYAVSNPYRGRLVVSGALGGEPAPYRLLVSGREPTLAGIIDRAIDHLHPAELDSIRRRWSLGQHPETLWERRRPQIELGAALGIGVVLLLVAWAVSLRTQIQRRIAAEDAMRVAKEEAETANRAKSTFLATMSHEIRTPMNAVLGLLELELRSARDRASTVRSLATAHQAARDLLGMIDDILDVAKIEAERLVLAPAPLDLDAWVAGVVAIYEPAARSKGIVLAVERRAGDGPAWVLADALRLRQVLGNLLSNAIKFTEKGAVTLAWGIGEPAGGAREVTLAVSDTGIGMTPGQQAALFAPFVQVHRDGGGRYGGTGLGLTICRRLVSMMGGTVEVSSEPGRGTCFTVRIVVPAAEPVAQEESVYRCGGQEAASEDASELAGLRVLVVDDHPANRMVLSGQLELLGCTPELANDGCAGLARWEADPRAFDLILTDCSMPVMSGEDLARAVRACEAAARRSGAPGSASGAPVPIIGVTANAQPEAAADAVVAGMNACLVKPLALDDLRRALLSAARRDRAAPQPRPRDAQPVRASSASRPYDPAIVDGFGDQAAALVDALQAANTQDLDDARAAMNDGDYARLRETAHRMKGAAFVVGATPFAQACLALQLACQSALDEGRGGERGACHERDERHHKGDERVETAFSRLIDEGAALAAALARRAA
jgi:two-component system sensor histidine kinase EvgS